MLQELHNTIYFCQTENVDKFDLGETIPGPSTDFYGAAARDNGIVLVASLFEKRSAGLYHNTAVVFDSDGSIAGKYRKMHIPDDPGYYEKFYFTPGDLGFHPIDTSVGRLGVLVCWDQWYPEAARLMALQGAELLIYPTAIGYDAHDTADEQQRQREAWQTVMRGHAVANGLPVVAVPRDEGPIVLDMAMSQYAYGKLGVYRLAGKQLPFPGGYDRDGNLTSDPGAIEDSMRILPMGYWKGSGMAIVLDLAAAILSDGRSGSDMDAEGRGSCTGCSQIFIAMDPGIASSMLS